MSYQLEISELRKELAGRDGLLSRIAAALHLDTHPQGVMRGLTEYCENSERARRNAKAATQPIRLYDDATPEQVEQVNP